MAGKKPLKRNDQLDDPEQSQRFIDAAREAGAAETEEEADRAFRRTTEKPKR